MALNAIYAAVCLFYASCIADIKTRFYGSAAASLVIVTKAKGPKGKVSAVSIFISCTNNVFYAPLCESFKKCHQ